MMESTFVLFIFEKSHQWLFDHYFWSVNFLGWNENCSVSKGEIDPKRMPTYVRQNSMRTHRENFHIEKMTDWNYYIFQYILSEISNQWTIRAWIMDGHRKHSLALNVDARDLKDDIIIDPFFLCIGFIFC